MLHRTLNLPVELQYSYGAADQLTCARFWWEQCPSSGGTAYGYDANGNQTSGGSDTFTYDHENRLVESVIDSVTSAPVYNGDGLRMSHTVGQTTTSYIWDIASGLPVVLQDGTNTYVYGLDLISATDDQDAQTYFLYDGLGSTVNLTDAEGDSTQSYSYDAFGVYQLGPPPGSNEWLFTGEQRDADSGLYYLRARYYDPAIGRFLSQDPFKGFARLPLSLNLYTYVFNRPTALVDPYGYWGIPNPAKAIKKTVKAVRDVVEEGVEAVEEYGPAALKQCAVWGVGGGIATMSLAGAAAGCAAGAGLVIADAVLPSNPVLDPFLKCAAWGGAGYVTGGFAGAAIGCATGVAGYYVPQSPEAQCGNWLAGAFAAAQVVGFLRNATNPHAVRAGVAGCLSGALSVHAPSVAYAASDGKE